MANTVPFEVIAAPFTAYVAPVGTAFPDLAETPAAPWVKIGSSGALNYDSDSGVTVEHSQSTNPWRSLGDSGARKIFRSEEDLKVSLQLADVTAEQYRYALNSNAVTDTPGASPATGNRKVGLSRGFTVATMALLVKGAVSPYGEDWNMQYEIPIAAQSGSPTVVFKKDTPALLQLEWMALVDSSAASEDERFGRIVMQDADAS